jgi:small subunit ribosomal protein S19
MARAKWKTPVFDYKFYKSLYFNDDDIKVWSRNNVIPETLLGKRVLIHNGNSFKRVLIFREKIGFKFGDFCSTRSYRVKIKNKKLKKKK